MNWQERLRARIEHGDIVPTDAQRKALDGRQLRATHSAASLPPLMPRDGLWPRQGLLPWPHGVLKPEPIPDDPMPAPKRVVVTTTVHTPKGANRDATGFEGRGSQEPDATDCEARGRVMSPEASASATGRGGNAPTARSAAPVLSSDHDPTLDWS